jgi:hypothetical protein
MKQFLKNNTIVICATVIILWGMTAVTVLVVTNNTTGLRTIINLLGPVVVNLVTILGLGSKLREAKSQVEDVHTLISNGDTNDASP